MMQLLTNTTDGTPSYWCTWATQNWGRPESPTEQALTTTDYEGSAGAQRAIV